MRIPWVLKFVLLIIISVFILDSCKKGADDPLISFRSRNSRICAKWKLTSFTGKYTNTEPTATIKELDYSYSGTDFTKTTIYNTAPQLAETYSAYNFQMELDKNYIFKFTESYSYNGAFYSTTKNDYWYWQDDKRKTMIYIPLSSADVFDIDNWEVTELKHSQITLKYSTSSTNTAGTETDERQIVFTNIE